ncbi:MAG: pyrroline-5-carboxylate reductase, partial [Ilumatobacteraceae bacterium]
ALLGGLLASDGADPAALAVTEALAARRDELTAQFPGVAVSADVPACTAAVIAVKPGDVAAAVGQAVTRGARRVLSIAAGVSIASLEAAAGAGVAVVRAMPNTPALVGKGAAAIAGGTAASADDLDWATGILGAVGTVARVDERQLDAVTALTGSGPAYRFLVAEALIDAAVGVGLPRPLAEALTTQLFVGSSALLEARGDPAALRAMVTSPAGTTAAGLHALEGHAVRAAFADAVRAAAERSAQLGA